MQIGMKVVVQRVSEARVVIEDAVAGEIGPGWLVLLGIAPEDSVADADLLADKVAGLRAFADDSGKMNLSVVDIGGSILVVSNFTLYGDCRKGRRPSFTGAARPDHAEPLYQRFIEALRALGIPVSTGEFGAGMQVILVNDGPVTLILDSEMLKSPLLR
jgi:D-aminoacyl-tRNA deacylase